MARTNPKSKTTAEHTANPAPSALAETTATTAAPAASVAPATDAPAQYKENEKTNKKIDDWIKEYPDQFKFFNEMPHERAVRKLILNEIDRYERRQFRKQQGNGENNSPRQERGQGYGGGRRY
jgi:hypothetical protein